MKTSLLLRATATLGSLIVLGAAACSSPFPQPTLATPRLQVTVTGGTKGEPSKRLPISFIQPSKVLVTVEARREDGSVDAGFNGFVRLSAKPGSIVDVRGEGANGRNVRLRNGRASDVEISLVAAYGDTRLWVEDAGYDPVSPLRSPKPQCADGLDNDGDGLADYPLDPGCTLANDDSEGGGSFTAAVSEVLYFAKPRIADVRGAASGGTTTPFKSEQVTVDTGYNATSREFEFNTVVTGISSNGFYATDLGATGGYGSIFSFTFSAPPRMRICDRIKTFTGTATEFYGMTQLASPTWTLEPWNPNLRPCFIPEPYVITAADVGRTDKLFAQESALVRVESAGENAVHIASHFGPKSPRKDAGFAPTEDASNCDLDQNGKIDFTPGTDEAACMAACNADVECSEFSGFKAQGNFAFVVESPGKGLRGRIQGNGTASAAFDPVLVRGKPVRAFTGILGYFSGGSQFTIEARCEDDIVLDLASTPKPSNVACVRPRTENDLNEASH